MSQTQQICSSGLNWSEKQKTKKKEKKKRRKRQEAQGETIFSGVR